MSELYYTFELDKDDAVISYLPYPHAFEQCITFNSVIRGCKIGYFQGDPLKLIDDCKVLQPAMFPSVPRLLNRVYSKIKGGIDEKKGCVGWLAKSAMESKLSHVQQTG
jgi:long-chain acyl-CoA synthetase